MYGSMFGVTNPGERVGDSADYATSRLRCWVWLTRLGRVSLGREAGSR
jgi:hypothetical protein